MADYKVTDTELTSIANAIRTKGGTQAQLEFPTGFVSAVQAIPTGGGVVQPLSVTQNGTYNPPSGVDGYAPVTVNVPGGGYTAKDYAKFDGSDHIVLPLYLDADYKITVDFEALVYSSDQSVMGTSNGVGSVFLTQYQSAWFTWNGSVVNFSGQTTGRHVFEVSNNGLIFDNEKKFNYTPVTQSSSILWVGGRAQNGQNFQGKIYSYKIESISTGDLILNLIPAEMYGMGVLIDTVAGKAYASGIEYCSDDS